MISVNAEISFESSKLRFTPLLVAVFKNQKKMNQKITFNDGTTIVHAIGQGQSDYALCGDDLAGDSGLGVLGGGYGEAQPTNDAIDCKVCLAVIEHVKNNFL